MSADELAFKTAACTGCRKATDLDEFLRNENCCDGCYERFLAEVIYGNVTEPDPLD